MTRKERVEALIRTEICEIFREKVSDPRIGFISVTKVEVSPDLENASIYVSIFGDEKKKEEAMQGFYSATKFVRGELGRRLELRFVPQIRFVRDDSLERGSNVLGIIKKLENEKRTGKNKPPAKKR